MSVIEHVNDNGVADPNEWEDFIQSSSVCEVWIVLVLVWKSARGDPCANVCANVVKLF